jgi:segregation and condensation protein B
MEELRRIIEALLFAAPEPLTMSRIKSIVPGTETQDIADSIGELAREYEGDARAFQIVEVANGWQITSKPDYAIWVDKLFESRGRAKLSRAALETLAVVAYKQPVVRSMIESIRGVSVDSVLRTLMERDLVRIVGRADGPGRPLLFGTTKEFLLRFGISRISDLPKIDEIEELTGEGAPVPGRQTREAGEAAEDADFDEASPIDVERAEYARAADAVEGLIRAGGTGEEDTGEDAGQNVREDAGEDDRGDTGEHTGEGAGEDVREDAGEFAGEDAEDARDDVAQGEAK